MLLDRSIWVGLLLGAVPLAVLAHGLFGTGSLVTSLLMVTPTAVLLILGDWRAFSPTRCDALFGLFVICIAVSVAWNGIGTDPKEFCLLALTLAAYPAARLNGARFFPMRGLVVVAAIIVAAGTLATVPALLTQWDDHGKPMVFGSFDAAPAQFATVLAFLLIVLANSKLSPRAALLASLLLAVPLAVFAASVVRFTIAALLVTLVVGIILSPRSQRWLGCTVLVVAILATIAGALTRHKMTATFAAQLADAVEIEIDVPSSKSSPGAARRAPAPAVPAFVCPKTDMRNSVAIRGQLYRDAFRLLPQAGAFGLGLDRFMDLGCIAGTEVHNSFLQAAIEFGWIAGMALVLLTLAVGDGSMRKLAQISPEIRVALCGLTFVTMLTLAHGRISRDAAFFVFLGYAAALKRQSPEIAASWLVRGGPWNKPQSPPA